MNSTRRQFLRHTALGAVAAGTLPALVRAQTAEAGLIDLHSHWFSPRSVEILSRSPSGPRFVTNEKGEKFLDRLGGDLPAPRGRFPLGKQWFDIEARLRHLDENGIRRQLVSWPTTLGVDAAITPDEARVLWAAYNEDLSAVVNRHSDRLSGVAALASGDIAWSARELDRAHDQLGLIGAVLPVNGFATLEGARAFAPIFAVAQKHKSHIYLHTGYANPKVPGQPPHWRHRDALAPRAALDNAWNFAASTITLAFSGFLDSYPDVTVQIAQLGGSGAIALVAEAVEQSADRNGITHLSEKFRQITLDTGAGGRGPQAIALAVRVFGAERIVFGTDYAPQPSVRPVIENIENSPISAADRQKIFTDNPRRILTAKGVAV